MFGLWRITIFPARGLTQMRHRRLESTEAQIGRIQKRGDFRKSVSWFGAIDFHIAHHDERGLAIR